MHLTRLRHESVGKLSQKCAAVLAIFVPLVAPLVVKQRLNCFSASFPTVIPCNLDEQLHSAIYDPAQTQVEMDMAAQGVSAVRYINPTMWLRSYHILTTQLATEGTPVSSSRRRNLHSQ